MAAVEYNVQVAVGGDPKHQLLMDFIAWDHPIHCDETCTVGGVGVAVPGDCRVC